MPTIQSRLVKYQQENLLPTLSQQQKIELGKAICLHYREESGMKFPIQRLVSVEPEGTFIVMSYPAKYVPEIDRIISEYYSKNVPKKRKRTIRQELAYSTKIKR